MPRTRDTNVILKDHKRKLLPRSVFINNIKTFNDRIEWNTDVVESDRDDGDVAEEESVELQYTTDDVQRDDPKEYSLHVVGLLLLSAAQIVLTPPAPRNGGPFFGQAGQVDPLVGWRCCY